MKKDKRTKTLYKEQLNTKRALLLSYSQKSKESRQPVELDQTLQGRISRQDALLQQSMALATEEKRKQEIARINNALERLKGDDFGYCISCDEEISEKRLKHDPAVATCINCAQ